MIITIEDSSLSYQIRGVTQIRSNENKRRLTSPRLTIDFAS